MRFLSEGFAGVVECPEVCLCAVNVLVGFSEGVFAGVVGDRSSSVVEPDARLEGEFVD